MIPLRTEPLARAAAWDAANRSARAQGREKWTAEDLAVAVAEYHRLWPESAEVTP